MSSENGAVEPRRTRGRPPRISRDQIVAAARRLGASDARDLTMQAVADELGVTRKALHYYVGDRQGLLGLVVLDRFEAELTDVELPQDDWQSVLRAYAYAFRDGLVQVGAAIEHSPLNGVGAAAALALAERVLDALLSAGFGADDARRGLTTIAGLAQSAAQSAIHLSAGQHDYQPKPLRPWSCRRVRTIRPCVACSTWRRHRTPVSSTSSWISSSGDWSAYCYSTVPEDTVALPVRS